jgi:glucose-6-phosphate 1-dehydrogenase
MVMEISPSPCYFVIFGATGNLASEKLLPSLYHLEGAGRIGKDLRFIAFSRRERRSGSST